MIIYLILNSIPSIVYMGSIIDWSIIIQMHQKIYVLIISWKLGNQEVDIWCYIEPIVTTTYYSIICIDYRYRILNIRYLVSTI